MAQKQNYDVYSEDFIAIYLTGGQLEVQLKLGGSYVGTLKVQQTATLHDGKWHTVDIFREKQVFSFLLRVPFY